MGEFARPSGPESGEGEGETAPPPSEFGSGAERGEATSHEPEEPEKGEKEEEDEEERRRREGEENSGSSI